MSLINEETDFVFMTSEPWPYLAKLESSGDWWIYFWSDNLKNFVSMRMITVAEMENAKRLELPKEQQRLYIDLAEKSQPDLQWKEKP